MNPPAPPASSPVVDLGFRLVVHLVHLLPRLLARASGLVGLVALAAVAHVLWKVTPPCYRHWSLVDAAVDAARRPVTDEQVRVLIESAIQQIGLSSYVRPVDLVVRSQGSRRRVTARYLAPVELLPGRMYDLHFELAVEEPFFLEPAPIFF